MKTDTSWGCMTLWHFPRMAWLSKHPLFQQTDHRDGEREQFLGINRNACNKWTWAWHEKEKIVLDLCTGHIQGPGLAWPLVEELFFAASHIACRKWIHPLLPKITILFSMTFILCTKYVWVNLVFGFLREGVKKNRLPSGHVR